MPPTNTADSSASCTKELIVPNENGLHARPAAMFVKTASRFKSEVIVEKDGEAVNGKSIMGLMMLAASKGTKLKIIAKGPDANAAVAAIEEIFRLKFNEV